MKATRGMLLKPSARSSSHDFWASLSLAADKSLPTLPWSALVPVAVWGGLASFRQRLEDAASEQGTLVLRFAVIWFVVSLLAMVLIAAALSVLYIEARGGVAALKTVIAAEKNGRPKST